MKQSRRIGFVAILGVLILSVGGAVHSGFNIGGRSGVDLEYYIIQAAANALIAMISAGLLFFLMRRDLGSSRGGGPQRPGREG